jgi:hypothetical protein
MVQERIAVKFWLTVGGVWIRELKMQLPIEAGAVGALLAALWGMNLSMAFGQIQSSNPARENLEEQFVDPLTTLPQVFLKDDFSPVNYGTDVQTNQVVARIGSSDASSWFADAQFLCCGRMDGLSSGRANCFPLEC